MSEAARVRLAWVAAAISVVISIEVVSSAGSGTTVRGRIPVAR